MVGTSPIVRPAAVCPRASAFIPSIVRIRFISSFRTGMVGVRLIREDAGPDFRGIPLHRLPDDAPEVGVSLDELRVESRLIADQVVENEDLSVAPRSGPDADGRHPEPAVILPARSSGRHSRTTAKAPAFSTFSGVVHDLCGFRAVASPDPELPKKA